MVFGKTSLVIGGSRGVGREVALESVRRGARTSVLARSFHEDDTDLRGAARLISADIATRFGWGKLTAVEDWDADYVFWIAGGYLRGRFVNASDEDIEGVITMHQALMTRTLRDLVRDRLRVGNLYGRRPKPLTFICIGSVSSFLLRKHEAVYAMAKAGQAAFLRHFAPELAVEIPGSRILLANCARLASRAGDRQMDAGGVRVDPSYVARTIWDSLEAPWLTYKEMNFLRHTDGVTVTAGAVEPEIA